MYIFLKVDNDVSIEFFIYVRYFILGEVIILMDIYDGVIFMIFFCSLFVNLENIMFLLVR